MNEVYLKQLRKVAEILAEPCLLQLDNDALIYAGSATVDDWRCHVPQIVCSLWPLMGEETRLAVYIMAKVASNGLHDREPEAT